MSAEEKILVVDDEKQIRQLLVDLLDEYTVVPVGSVDEAMDALISDSFDLVLTDIKMPEKSGLELVQDVMRYASNTPVIVMSGHGGKKETMECLRYGAYDFFEKPWECDDVLLSVRRALDKSSVQKHKEQLLLQLKVKNDELAKLNRVLLQEKKDRENYKLKKYYQRIIGHDIKNICQLLYQGNQENNPIAMKEGLIFLKNIIPLGLHWEQIYKQTKQANLVDVEISPLIERALILFEKKIQEKKLRIIKNNLGHTVLGEGNILTHFVIHNILDNAIKYSPLGHDIFISGIVEENSSLKLSIEDHGIGIPKEFMDTLIDIERPQLQLGTLGERGMGGGLSMVEIAMQYLKARWEILPLSTLEDGPSGTQVNLYFTLVN